MQQSHDQQGNLWFVSGRELFKREGGKWIYYEELAKPFDGWGMWGTTDREGNLWLTTSQGVVRYDGQHWVAFDAADGLADNHVNDILEDSKGNLWFATAKGITRYRPDKRPPQTRIAHGPEKTLGYGTSTLTFEFEGGDWEWEDQVTFSYALVKEDKKPQEEDWSEWTGHNFVQMSSSEDGQYAFHVRARDKVLNIDPTPAIHSFYIAPPLWKAVWFQVSIGLGLLLIVFSSGYAVRKRRLAHQTELALIGEQQQRIEVQQQLMQDLERARETSDESRRAAESANRAKSLFLANISHEIRTPMNAILGYAQILQRSTDLASDHRHAVETIQNSGDHLLHLINDVLDISRIEAGRMELNLADFDLRNLLETLGVMFELRCQQKRLGWRLEGIVLLC